MEIWYKLHTGATHIEKVKAEKSNKRFLWVDKKKIEKDCVYWKHYESRVVAKTKMIMDFEFRIKLAKLHLERLLKDQKTAVNLDIGLNKIK